MNAYDPDRLRSELHNAPAPELSDDLTDRAADLAGRRGRSRLLAGGGAVVALAVIGALVLPPLLDRGTPPVVGTPSPVPSVTGTPTPDASAAATPEPTSEPTVTPTSEPKVTPTATVQPGSQVPTDRLITITGVGDLQVGMSLADGIALGIATDQGDLCGPYDMTPEGSARFPNTWTDWTEKGLAGFAVQQTSLPDLPDDHAAYVTDAGIRLGATTAEVRAAYPDAEQVPFTEEDWTWVSEFGIPGLPDPEREAWATRQDGRALVFLLEQGEVVYILITQTDERGRIHGLPSC